ncbi:hypothetical protein LINPERPRIM_LOCUS16776 [Linum perenne]
MERIASFLQLGRNHLPTRPGQLARTHLRLPLRRNPTATR